MCSTKIIAMYLPQYHCIPENDLFWGNGFTDWVTVKNARPLYKGHVQPKVPLNNNYYNLSFEEDVIWQSNLAQKYGVYGFGVYHYWFNNDKNLLTKPAEIIRDSESIDINYFLAWDNASWKRSWSNVAGNDWAPLAEREEDKKGPAVMIQYEIGSEPDWENHYNYLRGHFLSSQYIKVNNKPVFIIFNYSEETKKMCEYWNQLSKNDGFDGVYYIYRYNPNVNIDSHFKKFKYEPVFSGWQKMSLLRRIELKLYKMFNLEYRMIKYNYDKIWSDIIENAKKDSSKDLFHGCFVQYDDSPRRGKKGVVVIGGTPFKFRMYMKQLLEISNKQNKPFVFLTAWNEWGEGAYLEPDEINKHSYLEAIKNI